MFKCHWYEIMLTIVNNPLPLPSFACLPFLSPPLLKIISCYFLVFNHNTSLVLYFTYKFDSVGVGIDNSTQCHWIITDSDGINVTLNAKVEHTNAGLNTYVWEATVFYGPTKYKSPYTYQCVVSNDCGVTLRSKLVTINYPTPAPTPTG